jgi:hypothetical protein
VQGVHCRYIAETSQYLTGLRQILYCTPPPHQNYFKPDSFLYCQTEVRKKFPYGKPHDWTINPTANHELDNLTYEGVSKSFRTGRLERELQMVQVSATSVQLYRYFVSHSSEFFHHNPLCYFSTSVYCCKRTFMTQSGNLWIHPHS